MESAKAAPGGEALCPRIEGAFELLSRKWAGLILYTLMEGERYFCELQRAIPALSARLLTLRLKEFEEAGLVTRMVANDTPVRVRYALTPKGAALVPALRGIESWAQEWMERPDRA